MKQFFKTILALIISIFTGLAPIEQVPEYKVYNKDNYYVVNSEDEPDYKTLYSQYSGTAFTSISECDKGSRKYESGYYPYQPSSNYYWFWLIDGSTPVSDRSAVLSSAIIQPGDDSPIIDGGWYVFELKEKVQLITIANAQLESAPPVTENAYPSDRYSKGVSITYSFIDKDRGLGFRVTYGSMLRWWCCMLKPETGDGTSTDEGGPRFGHTINFSKNDKFVSGFIVGESGLTGVPESLRADGETFVTVKIEKCNLDRNGNVQDNWTVTSLEDLYDL